MAQLNEQMKADVKNLVESTGKYEGQFSKVKNFEKRLVLERAFENQYEDMRMNKEVYQMNEDLAGSPVTQTAGIANWTPVMIKMLRRGLPKLMAFDICGVQTMNGPTDSIFSMRARYNDQFGNEALFHEADTAHSGKGTHAGDTSGFDGTETGTAMSLTQGENLGTDAGLPFNKMSFSIDRADVSAGTRKLGASFTNEMAYDLQKIHGLSARDMLGDIMGTEIMAEIDREVLRSVNISAVVGAQGTSTSGTYNVKEDSDGRWMAEQFKGLLFQIELEANRLAKATRRGKGNVVICSSNVASALNMAGVLEFTPALEANLDVDDTGRTVAGLLLGRYKVCIDPYATTDYITVGYKGDSNVDAGIYFCPYVPLTLRNATDPRSFQPVLAAETRYGLVANPFTSTQANGTMLAGRGLGQGENLYFRKFKVAGIGTA